MIVLLVVTLAIVCGSTSREYKNPIFIPIVIWLYGIVFRLQGLPHTVLRVPVSQINDGFCEAEFSARGKADGSHDSPTDGSKFSPDHVAFNIEGVT